MSEIILLADTNGQVNVIGSAYRVDRWFNAGEDFSISIHYHNLKGRIYLEATLADQPTEDDWFPLWLSASAPYLEFPKNMAKPTGSPGYYGDTGVDAFTFEGNFAWVRARLDRNYVFPVPVAHDDIAAFGVITKIVLKR